MKQISFLMIVVCSVGFFCADAKLLVMTHAFNRPDFIKIQDTTFKKFLHDEYEFVVFNDGKTYQDEQMIEHICRELNLRCIRIPQEIHERPYLFRLPREDKQSPCCRCANVVQYSLNEYGFKHDDLVMIIDSDMFLVKDFSVAQYLDNNVLAGVDQQRGGYHYMWNGLLFFNMSTLPNKETIDFNCGELFGVPVDVGGQTYHYLQKHRDEAVCFLDVVSLADLRCDGCKNKQRSPWCSHNTQVPYAQLCEDCKQINYRRIFTNPCTHNAQKLVQLGYDSAAISLIQKCIYNSEFLVDHHFFHYRSGQNWDGQPAHVHEYRTQLLQNYVDEILLQ